MRLLKKTLVQLASMSALAVWVLQKVERDYEEKGELSSGASALAWVLYLLHVGLTISASISPSKRLPADRKLATALGVTVAVSGGGLLAGAIREFRSFEQMSGLETGQLVKSGPYRYSRNPQVVGWLLALLGAALAGRSAKALILVGFFFLIHRLHTPTEERHLERTFGEEYLRYRAEVPRFLGFPRAG
jgi:protein-S-isoprenylcysteine O-methyltransferase Ste14